ncbi:MAG TPA: Crp/Fnr family transcriptional regulator [Baekduia sp.]|nr:Crp/Fnr family transcriptional regulator [Baekduia sp.]
MDAVNPDLVRVFDLDPELVDDLDSQTATHLRHRMVARRLWLERGTWEPRFDERECRSHLGLLVLDGLLVRTMRLAGRECSEVVGPGDLIRPWDSDDGGSVECVSQWRVLQPAVCANLDAAFAARIARWPGINAALLRRSTRRARSLVYQATIAHVRHAETRILLLLWQLADRWGRVTPDGVLVPAPLTHQLLAQLTCLQRPTVSGALSRLAEAGELTRVPGGGGWMLHGEPPADCEGGTPAWRARAAAREQDRERRIIRSPDRDLVPAA